MAVTLYHNPNCSKSRATLALLQAHGVEPVVIEYMQTPPTRAQLDELLRMLGLGPREFMRKKEKPYETLALDAPALSRDELIDALVKHPILIERPIVVHADRAAIGRPPEAVLAIL